MGMHVAVGEPMLRSLPVWKVRPQPSMVWRCIKTAMVGMPPIKEAMSKGVWLARLAEAASRLDAANRIATVLKVSKWRSSSRSQTPLWHRAA